MVWLKCEKLAISRAIDGVNNDRVIVGYVVSDSMERVGLIVRILEG